MTVLHYTVATMYLTEISLIKEMKTKQINKKKKTQYILSSKNN